MHSRIQEMKEMMETMMEADVVASVTPSPEAAAKVCSVARLMRSLNLDPEAVRRREPCVRLSTSLPLGSVCTRAATGPLSAGRLYPPKNAILRPKIGRYTRTKFGAPPSGRPVYTRAPI